MQRPMEQLTTRQVMKQAAPADGNSNAETTEVVVDEGDEPSAEEKTDDA